MTRAPATPEHQEAFNQQTSNDADDRGMCLLVTAHLENELDRAIDHWVASDDKTLRDELYGGDGPLGTFARKTAFAAAVRIVGPISRANLRGIRCIRNAFAHAKQPIDFDTPEVTAVCADLVPINIYDPPRDIQSIVELSPRKQFERVVGQTMILLSAFNGFDIKMTDENGKPDPTLKSAPLP